MQQPKSVIDVGRQERAAQHTRLGELPVHRPGRQNAF
jgi:hypothetical protein